MTWRVMVDDNFHYMDESERYEHGKFATRAEAEAACRRIVDENLASYLKPGMSAEELFAQYTMFGEDPFIYPPDGELAAIFSAWNYARERCNALTGQDQAK